MPRKAGPVRKVIKPSPYAGYYDPEQVRQRAEIVAMAERDAVWKCEGFADMVLAKGYMAVHEDRYGKVRSWQEIGRNLFGKETFNAALKAAMDRKRAGPTSQTSERQPVYS